MNKEYHSKRNYPQLILLRDGKKEIEQVTKVGIIPFIPHEEDALWQYKLMKPHAEPGHPGNAPEFQIAKGTRRINMGGGWCDMRDDDLLNADPVFYENLVDTALREGREEIGLKRSNVRRMYDIGVFSITSARKRIQKRVHVFAAYMISADDFGDFESKTAQTEWMTMARIEAEGREDNIPILRNVHEALRAMEGM